MDLDAFQNVRNITYLEMSVSEIEAIFENAPGKGKAGQTRQEEEAFLDKTTLSVTWTTHFIWAVLELASDDAFEIPGSVGI